MFLPCALLEPRRVFVAIVSLTCLAHAATLMTSPIVWQDEVQIIDYGRTLVSGSDQRYGLSWSSTHRPTYCLSYIGPLMQEAAYRFASGTLAGPRVSAMIGAVAAAYTLRGWLLAAGVSPWLGLTSAWLFFWDPLFTSSYRGARVDSWCIAAMLAALWCLRLSSRHREGTRMLIAAGGWAAVGALVWPSAAILMPLIAYETWDSCRSLCPDDSNRSEYASRLRFVRRSSVVAGSAVLVVALLLLPFADTLASMVGDFHYELVMSGRGPRHASMTALILKLIANFRNCPPLPLVAIGGTLLFGRRSLLLPLAGAVGASLATDPYAYRAVYLVPYFIYAFGTTANRWSATAQRRAVVSHPGLYVAALLLMWSGAISIGVRTMVAVLERQQRNPAIAGRLVDGLCAGRGETRVVLNSWSLYYAARSRGFAFRRGVSVQQPGAIARWNPHYVIYDESAGDSNPGLDDTLRSLGYRRYVVAAGTRSSVPPPLQAASDGYGPYVVYASPWTGRCNKV